MRLISFFLVRRVLNSLPAGRAEKNEPNAFGKGHADKQAFNLNRNIFALCRQNRPRENLVNGCLQIYDF